MIINPIEFSSFQTLLHYDLVRYFISLDLEHFCLMSDYFSLIIFSTMNDLGGHECQLFLGHFVFQLKNAFELN